MCGIAGYFGSKLIDKIDIDKCSRSLNHRGPDGVGIYKRSSNNKIYY